MSALDRKKKRNTYDQFAQEYSAVFGSRDENGLEGDSKPFFDLIGEVEGLHVLDAGCGEGFVARVLSTRCAKVTAIDISKPLVEIGRSKDPEGQIDFRVADLSQPLPDSESRFDLVVSNYVLNDVPDYKGFIRTLASVTKPGGRLVFSLNNPYSAVSRKKASSYFGTGTSVLYQGMAEAGVKVYYYHRTMSEYIDAFRENGLLLRTLVDLPPHTDDPGNPRSKWHNVPFLMVIELVRP